MKIIDLTNEISDGMKSHFNVTITDYLTHEDTRPRLAPPALGYATKALMLCDHTSTHVDASSHFWPGEMDIDVMPLDKFCGDAVVLDFSHEGDGGIELSLKRFLEFTEENSLEVKAGEIVLFNFGAAYSGISEKLAAYLSEIPVKMVGTDGGTIDCPFNKSKPGHVNLLRKDIPIIETLRNLETVANRRILFFGLPLKLKGATGSPIRAIAVLDR